MDGHTAWANRALLQRAGITSDFLKKLSAGERSYYGVDKDMQPNGFLVDAGVEKIEPPLPPPSAEKLLAAGRAALAYNYSLGITAWLICWLPITFCGLQDAGGAGRADFSSGGISTSIVEGPRRGTRGRAEDAGSLQECS